MEGYLKNFRQEKGKQPETMMKGFRLFAWKGYLKNDGAFFR